MPLESLEAPKVAPGKVDLSFFESSVDLAVDDPKLNVAEEVFETGSVVLGFLTVAVDDEPKEKEGLGLAATSAVSDFFSGNVVANDEEPTDVSDFVSVEEVLAGTVGVVPNVKLDFFSDEGVPAGAAEVEPKEKLGFLSVEAVLVVLGEDFTLLPKEPNDAVFGAGGLEFDEPDEPPPPRGASHATHFAAPFSFGTKHTSHFVVLSAFAHKEFPEEDETAGVAMVFCSAFLEELTVGATSFEDAEEPPRGASHATHCFTPLSLGTRQTSHFTVLRAFAHSELPPGAEVFAFSAGDFSSNLAIEIGFVAVEENEDEDFVALTSVAGRRLAGGEKAKLIDDRRV